MVRTRISVVLLCAALFAALPTWSQQNLIVNGDAETGTSGANCSGRPTISGWVTDGKVGACPYGYGDYLAVTAPGPANRGAMFFDGGYDAVSIMTQNISVSSAAAQIDAGTQPYTLSGWLGGWAGQNDNARLKASFLNAGGTEIGSVTIGPVLAVERKSVSGLLEKTTSGNLPAGTRTVKITLEFRREEGSANDGYADNLSFVLGGGVTPPPASGANLILNPGAEEGATDVMCNGTPVILRWTTDGKAGICKHGGSDMPLTAPGPADRGNYFFAGGTAAKSTISQVIDLSSYATQIDSGTQAYTLSGWLGGWESQNDNAALKLTFKATDQRTLGTAAIGPVLAADRTSTSLFVQRPVTGFVQKTATGTLPVGTRRVDVLLEITREEGTYNDGYADNLSFTLAQGGVTPPPNCAYNVAATSTVSGSGGTGTVLVVTAADCQWTAVSNAPWITITAGATGRGNGAVSYTAQANPGTTARTGTITIAGQTHTVTQGAATPTCTHSLSPASASVPAAGGSGGFLVQTATGCSWTAGTTTSWITIRSGASGSGNGTVNYTAAANASTAARTGSITAGGQTFTLSQAGVPPAGAPKVTSGGVVNAASYMSASLPAGAIARGSFFSIFGTNLGPQQWAKADKYPLGTTLGGVAVRITQGSRTVEAIPVFVAASQINAILPSNAPLGDATLTIVYNGNPSEPFAMKIVESNFGAFSTAAGRGPAIIQNYVSPADQPLNTKSATAKPGQLVILWGTGLGPITGPDNAPPPVGDLPASVEVFVGGKAAKKVYSGRAPEVAGVDNIYFEVPADAPGGCFVPVSVKVGSSYSNTVTMAIDRDGKPCSDPLNPFIVNTTTGRKGGTIFLLRAEVQAQLEAGKPPLELLLDLGIGGFQQTQGGGDLGYNPLYALPPLGSCASYTGEIDLGSLLGSPTEVPNAQGLLGTELDAGKALTVTGPAGKSIPLEHLDPETGKGPYVGLLGGSLPIGEGAALPPFLDGGEYRVSGTGGKDVGPFSATISIPTPARWSNRDQTTTLDRSAGITFNWSGGNAQSQMVVLGGVSTDQKSKATGGFFCFVPLEPRTFTVGRDVLGNMPATSGGNALESAGLLIFGTLPAGNLPTFNASGIESGRLMYGQLSLKTVTVK